MKVFGFLVLFVSMLTTRIWFVLFILSLLIERGAPVSTSLGFCLTLLPLLSIGVPSMGNGEDYFIRAVPTLELSTPEGYLNSMEDDFINPSSSSPTEIAIDEDEDVEKNAGMETEVEESLPNEETPLLSS